MRASFVYLISDLHYTMINNQASQSIHYIHSQVECNGLTLGRSILPVEWIHPIQNGWIEDGLIQMDSAP